MEKMKAWSALGGTTPAEKLGALGIFEGRTLDVRFLDEIARTYGVTVTLFFEEDLARTRTLESVQQEFAHVPEFERPYVAVGSFLKFTRENDPSFEQTMREFPLMIEIVTVGETCSKEGKSMPYVAGLMPFLDEMDVEGQPPN
ncbi:MAG: hypothetical protein CVV30_00075 [Methanomicrobiales archaeon HGW-Methanomicrobiales-1]|jgi:hypothetical protein|nr:MAG: hypothetical protein CVV30_00075 [Methanomicrobiales archaeon HGW-Methanomicrobiales-1]